MEKGRTSAKQSKMPGEPHERTIYDNANFAKGIDAVKEVAPELADKILKPKPDEPKLSKRKRTLTIRQIELVWLHKEHICRPTHSTW
ncbi:MAG: hypothetical protein QM438_12165 [Euryarchaeota archaeon]|jgi:hypothetical protein|nr:hypothetical protein [Euryarchaeota archaeon]